MLPPAPLDSDGGTPEEDFGGLDEPAVVLSEEDEVKLAALLAEVGARDAESKVKRPRQPSMKQLLGQAKMPTGRRLDEVALMGEAVRMRTAGMRFPDIAIELGCSQATAQRLVDKWIRLQVPSEEQTEALRQVMLERLEELHATYWNAARGIGTRSYTNKRGVVRTKDLYAQPSERYGELILKIMDREAKLMGVDLQPNAQTIVVTAESIAQFLGWDPQAPGGVVDVQATEMPALPAGVDEGDGDGEG